MFLRGNIYYTDFFYNGKRYRQSLKTSNEADARARENTLIAYMREEHITAQEITFWRDFKAWYMRFVCWHKSKGTQYIVTRAITLFEEYKIPYYVRHITPDWVAGFKAFLDAEYNGKCAAARNRYVKAIKSMMRTGELMGKIGVTQCWRVIVKDKSENENRVEFHAEWELAEIKRVLEGDLLTAFYLGWGCGLRRGEMAYLYKTDYNPLFHTITISKKPEWQPKTQKSARTIPLTPEVEQALLASISASPNSPYLINLPGKRQSSGYIGARYSRTLKRALPHLHCYLHKLRHTYGSLLVAKGVNIKTVSDLMGHRNILQTEKYLHLGFSQYANAVSCLPKI